MAKIIDFNCVPGIIGKYESNLLLRLSGKNLSKVRRSLTITNTAAKKRLKVVTKNKTYYESKIDAFNFSNIKPHESQYIDAVAGLERVKSEIEELKTSVENLFYEDDGDDVLVPAGFWWLAETLDGDAAKNTDLQPYYLDGLRDYQIECLNELYKHRRCMTETATGLGKSKIIISIALAAVKSNKRCMIIVPSEFLVTQMYYEIKELHNNTSALGGDFKHPKLGWDILVTTMDSAHKYIDEAEVLIGDEFHHGSARTWLETMSMAIKATHVYCLTATAFREDGMDMAIHAFAGPVVYERDAKWGIDNGWLNDVAIVQMTVTVKKNGKNLFIPEYVQAQRAYKALVCSETVFAMALGRVKVAIEKGRKVMIIFKTVKAAMLFKKYAQTHGVEIGVAHANKKLSKDPKWALRQFRDGKLNAMAACDKLVSEGINIPDASFLLLLTQNSSNVTTSQMLGRILRKNPDKPKSIVMDIVVSGYRQFEFTAKKRLNWFKKVTNNITELKQ